MAHLAVVGGGLAGLVAAYQARRAIINIKKTAGQA